MRFPLLVFVLCGGSVALCHSQEVKPTQDRPARSREWLVQRRGDLNELPKGWHVDFSQPFQMPGRIQPPQTAARLQSRTIDPKCIVHPPQASLGALSSGTAILQDRYPGLKIMPIAMDSERLEPR